MSGATDPSTAKRLDEVRAKIFYLASDVEQASLPAAQLLRAVAASICDATDLGEPRGSQPLDAQVNEAGVLSYSRANGHRIPPSRARVAVPSVHQLGSAGQKR